jgi:hypothetical protein
MEGGKRTRGKEKLAATEIISKQSEINDRDHSAYCL